MTWSAVYIFGKGKFQRLIISRLERKWMQGSPEAIGDLLMFWLPESTRIRSLKMAIGSKLILKHRLQFITNLNFHLNPEKTEPQRLALSETKTLDKIVQSDVSNRKNKTGEFLRTNEVTETNFTITEMNEFVPNNYPSVMKELSEIKAATEPQWHPDNEIMLLSYLKHHMISVELVQSHPDFVKVLTIKNACHHLESLFNSYKDNAPFVHSIEIYITAQLRRCPNS